MMMFFIRNIKMTLGLSPKSLIERNREKQKQWRLEHPERVKEFHRKYNSRSEVKLRKLEWARLHKDQINEKIRELYKINKSVMDS